MAVTPEARTLVLFWQLCALLVRAEPKERRGNALALLQDLMQAMGLSATHKAQVVTIVKQVLAGKELPLPELVAALAQSVSHHPVTLDFVFELLVYVGLAPGALSPNQLKALLACAPALGVDKVRLQHIMQALWCKFFKDGEFDDDVWPQFTRERPIHKIIDNCENGLSEVVFEKA